MLVRGLGPPPLRAVGRALPGGQALGPAMPAPGVTAEEMPADVQALLRSKCAGCHTYGQADPAGWGSVLDVSRMIDVGHRRRPATRTPRA